MRRLTIVVVALLTTVLAASPALAVDEVNTKRLRNAVTVGGILAHERVFQRIANQNGGTRASGTPGYDASAAYVQRRLEAAGVRAAVRDGRLRASFHLYTTEADIDTALNALTGPG